ncbi:hypothetical protein CY34DRAFT_810227 [Suillus luteus UH-Slu-Lm8-n1]|uniref:Uncharacterized protein n=1 Tax=Suillus luteus UH-Slu-Lm8-n1 TaxID=930992 RepID=A0A0D0AHF3_9AGAM|nr:hypothetical protein CY34DRAFT_810227 [Suillus luteus UH-Slu-Lm8-n1]
MGCMRASELEMKGLFNVAIGMFTRTKTLFQSRLSNHSCPGSRIGSRKSAKRKLVSQSHILNFV